MKRISQDWKVAEKKKNMKSSKDHVEGEKWCISKHLMLSYKRLEEVATKHLSLTLASGPTPIADIPIDNDLFYAVCNMAEAEEHIIYTYYVTGNGKYLAILDTIRRIRAKYLKALLSGTLSGFLTAEIFEDSYALYSIFWMLQFKTGGVEKDGTEKLTAKK